MADWHLRDKLGLNESRLALLDTTTGGQLSFDVVQTQAKRLFKPIHLNESGADRPPLENRFRSGRSDDTRSVGSRFGKGDVLEEFHELGVSGVMMDVIDGREAVERWWLKETGQI